MNKIKIRTRTILQVIVALLIVGVALYFRHYNNTADSSIIEKGKYTIGETTGSSSNWLRSSTKGLHYRYSVGGVEYNEVRQFEALNGVKISEGLYIVKFLPENPSKSLILIDTPVVFKATPPSLGWSEIPNFVIHLKN